jgi:glycosyltransferase involved in cell wall biosynthesis
MNSTRATDLDSVVDSAVANGIRRIQVVAYRDLDDPTAGGSERYVHEVLSRWAKGGLTITLRTVEVPGSSAVIERSGYTVERRGGHTLGAFRTTAAGAVRLRRGVDAVVEVWNGLPFWTPLWWRGPQVTVLHHLHDELWRTSFSSPVARAGSFVERRVAPLVYRGVPIATLSESSGDDLELRTPFHGDAITVVPPGIDESFIPGPDKSSDPLVVAAGRFVPAKRFDAIVATFAKARSTHPRARLVLIGDGPERPHLEDQIATLQLADAVELAGWVEESRLRELYSSAWVLAAASISEGWGMTITEAAACATPAVASDVVGHRDAMSYSAGRLVDSDAAMSDALVELLDDGEATARLGASARSNSVPLTWDNTAARVLELLVADSERRR